MKWKASKKENTRKLASFLKMSHNISVSSF